MTLFIILNILDCITTYFGIVKGSMEANIILAWLMSIDIKLALAIKMVLAVGISIVIKKIKYSLFKILNIAFLIIVLWNILVVTI